MITQRNAICLVVALAGLLPTSSPSEDLHPLLQAFIGTWDESGVLIPGEGAAPIKGVAKFQAAANEEGPGVVIRGSADYGPIKWDYVWNYATGEKAADYTPLVATYVDSLGQKIRYQGQINEEDKQLQLISNLADGGKAKAQITFQEDGSILIQNVNEDSTETPKVRYNGTAKKVEQPEE